MAACTCMAIAFALKLKSNERSRTARVPLPFATAPNKLLAAGKLGFALGGEVTRGGFADELDVCELGELIAQREGKDGGKRDGRNREQDIHLWLPFVRRLIRLCVCHGLLQGRCQSVPRGRKTIKARFFFNLASFLRLKDGNRGVEQRGSACSKRRWENVFLFERAESFHFPSVGLYGHLGWGMPGYSERRRHGNQKHGHDDAE